MTIKYQLYEKKLKCGWYHTRSVFRVTDTEVLYRFDTESDGYRVGSSTPAQFKRWMRHTEQWKESRNAGK